MTRQQKTWMLDAGQSSPDYALVHFVSPMPKQRAGPAIHARHPREDTAVRRRDRGKRPVERGKNYPEGEDVMPLRPRRARTYATVRNGRAHDGGGGSSSSCGQPRFKPEQDFLNQVLAPEGGKTRRPSSAHLCACAQRRLPSPGSQENSLAFASSEPPNYAPAGAPIAIFPQGRPRRLWTLTPPQTANSLERVMFLNQKRLRRIRSFLLAATS